MRSAITIGTQYILRACSFAFLKVGQKLSNEKVLNGHRCEVHRHVQHSRFQLSKGVFISGDLNYPCTCIYVLCFCDLFASVCHFLHSTYLVLYSSAAMISRSFRSATSLFRSLPISCWSFYKIHTTYPSAALPIYVIELTHKCLEASLTGLLPPSSDHCQSHAGVSTKYTQHNHQLHSLYICDRVNP